MSVPALDTATVPPVAGIEEAPPAAVRRLRDAGDVILLDVRETHEYEFEHIPGAFLLPLSFLDTNFFPPLTGRKIVLICAVGKRSLAAGKQLQEAGVEGLVNMTGGMKAWSEAGYVTEGTRFESQDYVI
ncbi:MAG: rhodanese-like domain-containing protein [Rhodospirillales bacterium]|nr:rhodanese-like domain-containing protein [Rhodospirillales bacterium]MCW8862180.1 rhodanese-like domain-containing protein [Rhodospirillales bacterium]MCW8970548.1 rhodanese-like domain-containing protein [Rhodospirillales bacterium]MCW9002756.1 rhodanese-like domain-containing protein [Rhodospirillales bacterium]